MANSSTYIESDLYNTLKSGSFAITGDGKSSAEISIACTIYRALASFNSLEEINKMRPISELCEDLRLNLKNGRVIIFRFNLNSDSDVRVSIDRSPYPSEGILQPSLNEYLEECGIYCCGGALVLDKMAKAKAKEAEVLEAAKRAKIESNKRQLKAAIKTLKSLGYEWKGGEQWKPPLGEPPEFSLGHVKINASQSQIDELNSRLECYMALSVAHNILSETTNKSEDVEFALKGLLERREAAQNKVLDLFKIK